MTSIRSRLAARVVRIVQERPGAQEIEADADGEVRKALNLIHLTGAVKSGDRILLNCTAVELGLGTGGLDLVIAVDPFEASWIDPPGHLMKLRYAPHQMPVLSIEAPESPFHEAIDSFRNLDELPVVCCELHSQLPAVIVAFRAALAAMAPHLHPRIVFLMQDSASLPMALSRVVHDLKSHQLLDVAISCGQAFGGDYEAINLYSGLAAASAVFHADLVVVGQGPGNAGTGTRLGFSGLAQAEAINAAGALGGQPIMPLRLSFADGRERHQGLSHHSRSVLEIALYGAIVPLPNLDEARKAILHAELNAIPDRHRIILEEPDFLWSALQSSPLPLRTMGRGLEEEREFYLACAAAGLCAAKLVEAREKRKPSDDDGMLSVGGRE